jgi:hypothetical protein
MADETEATAAVERVDHPSLAAALSAFQGEVPAFAKTKTARVEMRNGGAYSYKYTDLGDIIPVVGPLLAKHGLSWSAKPGRAEDGALVLKYELRHVSGGSDSGEMPLLGVGPDCKPQEFGSAQTYLRRYAMSAQLNIATEEDDDGRGAQEAANEGPRLPARASAAAAAPSAEDHEAMRKTVTELRTKLKHDHPEAWQQAVEWAKQRSIDIETPADDKLRAVERALRRKLEMVEKVAVTADAIEAAAVKDSATQAELAEPVSE